MGKEVTLGGDRLGSGNKQKVWLHNYERSTHDLGFIWRSTMASGTLVPFMSIPALLGDTFDINLQHMMLTHPTIGPLLGTYKVQLDVFFAPIRLYQAELHMNKVGIGRKMNEVYLPQIELVAPPLKRTEPIDNQHTNPSSLLAYLGIRGNGHHPTDPFGSQTVRHHNAVPYLAYYDIYKQYYANKQEETGYVIHRDIFATLPALTSATLRNVSPDNTAIAVGTAATPGANTVLQPDSTLELVYPANSTLRPENVYLTFTYRGTTWRGPVTEIFLTWQVNKTLGLAVGSNINPTPKGISIKLIGEDELYFNLCKSDPTTLDNKTDTEPEIYAFPLENIDLMRDKILKNASGTQYVITSAEIPPYQYPLLLTNHPTAGPLYSTHFSQEGLCLKTYNSDLFNNWITTDWIDGVDGISEITKIDTTSGGFTIDELMISRKIYDMMMRITVSGGTYYDWLEAIYDESPKSIETPIYLGGLIKTLAFQEVISNAATEEQPLGTLAGRGKLTDKHLGGNIIAKITEPGYIIGIISITPNIDYSQGNTWDTILDTMDDFHKPGLDEIGFQDLITDQMAWWDTGMGPGFDYNFKSAGKQPAWVNYMTNVNVVRGNFADVNSQMWMTLNRRYNLSINNDLPSIADLTTYIDPVKFNHIFADTRRDAQNFWAQIAVDITARRKMSAKLMPNL